MGFKMVYKALLEVFPEVDARILKAVAIEHPKDADLAVESVLLEVLPSMSTQSSNPGYFTGNPRSKGLKEERATSHLGNGWGKQVIVEDRLFASSSKSGASDAALSDHLKGVSISESKLNGGLHGSLISNCYAAIDNHSVTHSDTGGEGNGVSRICGEPTVKLESEHDLCTGLEKSCGPVSNHYNTDSNRKGDQKSTPLDTSQVEAGLVVLKVAEISGTSADWPGSSILSENVATWEQGSSSSRNLNNDHDELAGTRAELGNQCNSTINGNIFEEKLPLENIDNAMQDAPESALGLELSSATLIRDTEEKTSSSTFGTASKDDSADMLHHGDEVSSSTVIARSGQICRIELLERIVEDSKSNKKTLFSAVESVINLMREVELQERAAEEAKEEASRGGVHILARVEEIKEMLIHAIEGNDMHAGEVYGEKAILATEARELQSRLLSLSDERDRSLAILDEMRQTLEGRLTAAETARKAAEQEKLKKENLARDALAEQELIMEKVVEESKMLQQEADENSKLREFLMDRGRLVDMLQGEISVICQDVRSLKENFDEQVPLSKSVSSSQTSCILASSSTSVKSGGSDQGAGQSDSLLTPRNRSRSPSIDSVTPRSRCEDDGARDDKKSLSDDGWELFDKDAEFSV